LELRAFPKPLNLPPQLFPLAAGRPNVLLEKRLIVLMKVIVPVPDFVLMEPGAVALFRQNVRLGKLTFVRQEPVKTGSKPAIPAGNGGPASLAKSPYTL